MRQAATVRFRLLTNKINGRLQRRCFERYIAYEQGQSLLMLPGDLLGTWLHYLFPAIPEKNWRQLVVSFLIFIPLNIAAVVTCFWLLKEFGFNERIAQLGSVIFFLGTTFLHYAQIHQQNNQLLLFVMIGYVAALAYSFSKNPSLAFMSGLALGGAMLMRITSLIHALSVFLFFLSCLIYQYRERLKQSVPELIKAIGIWSHFARADEPNEVMNKEVDAKEVERCKVPDFAKAMGHEEKWKLHNNCK